MILVERHYRFSQADESKLVADLLGAIRLGLTVTLTTVPARTDPDDGSPRHRHLQLLVTPAHDTPGRDLFTGGDRA